MVESLVELDGSRRPPPRGAIRLRDVDPQATLHLTVTLKGRELPSLEAFAARTLDRAAIDAEYGVDAPTLQRVEAVLTGYGLQVTAVRQGGRSLRVVGSAAAVVAAFKPDLGIYEIPGLGQVRARTGVLMIPAELVDDVTGVFGLDQRRMAHRHPGAARAVAASSEPLTPPQLEAHYNFPEDVGGQAIAIAEFGQAIGDGQALPPAFFASDVKVFCDKLSRPTPNVSTVSVGLSPLTPDQYALYLQRLSPDLAGLLEDQTGETMMDVEIVAALCPRSDISVYFTTWGEAGWIDLLDEVTAAAKAPVALSISYGLAEESPDWSKGAMKAINDRLKIAAMRGITVCVSSGDDGSGCDQPGERCHVEFPASSPFVLSVGGTMLAPAPVDEPAGEIVWWQSPGRRTPRGGGSTGAGVSLLNPRPPWQPAGIKSLNEDASDGRIVPDVSALAGPPFYELVFRGQDVPGGNGGTSAATPLWAALIARIDAALPPDKRQHFLAPLLYQVGGAGSGFRDIVSGGNQTDRTQGYQAGEGFDAVSGWGVPDGQALLKALAVAAIRDDPSPS